MATIDLPTQSSQEAIQNVIESELKTDKFKTNIAYGSELGDNYIGVIYRVTATETVDNDSNNGKGSSVSVILKVPPENPARREQFFARPCFVRETLVYDEVTIMIIQNLGNIKCAKRIILTDIANVSGLSKEQGYRSFKRIL